MLGNSLNQYKDGDRFSIKFQLDAFKKYFLPPFYFQEFDLLETLMLSLFLAKALGVVVTLEWSCAFCTAPASIIKAFSC